MRKWLEAGGEEEEEEEEEGESEDEGESEEEETEEEAKKEASTPVFDSATLFKATLKRLATTKAPEKLRLPSLHLAPREDFIEDLSEPTFGVRDS